MTISSNCTSNSAVHFNFTTAEMYSDTIYTPLFIQALSIAYRIINFAFIINFAYTYIKNFLAAKCGINGSITKRRRYQLFHGRWLLYTCTYCDSKKEHFMIIQFTHNCEWGCSSAVRISNLRHIKYVCTKLKF